MTIGIAFALIAVGAVLRFAVTGHVTGLNVAAIGVILMVVGAAGLILSLVLMTRRRRTDVVTSVGNARYAEPGAVLDPRLAPPVADPRVMPPTRTTYVETADPLDPRL